MKVTSSLEIRYRDIDSMGHVNNAVYLSYFEQARMAFFNELIQEKWDWETHGILVARHEVDYTAPILLIDNAYVDTWCESMGNTSLVFRYEVYKSVNDQRITCTLGKTIIVCFDAKAGKTIPVPEEWKSKIQILS